MSAVDVVVAIAGVIVMILMLAGMFLITPRGTVTVNSEGSAGQGSDLSPVTRDPEVVAAP